MALYKKVIMTNRYGIRSIIPGINKILLLIAGSFLPCSCASVLNKPYKNVTIHTTRPSTIICNKDTIATVGNKASLKVLRNKNPLTVTTISDTLTKTVSAESHNSLAFNSNIFFNCGLGMLVDLRNPKRFTYPSHIYINSSDTITKLPRHDIQKGDVYLNILIPYINNLQQQPQGEGTKNHTGFLGFGLGLDYYYTTKRFLNFTTSAGIDFLLPFPAPVDYTGNYEVMSSIGGSVSHNHQLNRFSLGYGLSFAHNSWGLREGMVEDGNSPMREAVTKSSNLLGFVFPLQYRIGRKFHAGIRYQPYFINLDAGQTWRYEHTLSLELLWKSRL